MALYKTTTATDQNVDTTLRDHYWDPPHITSVQYCGGCSVHWRLFSTLEVVQYIGGITSVLWGIASVLWGIASILWGDSFSIVEVVQYSGGITSVHVGG